MVRALRFCLLATCLVPCSTAAPPRVNLRGFTSAWKPANANHTMEIRDTKTEPTANETPEPMPDPRQGQLGGTYPDDVKATYHLLTPQLQSEGLSSSLTIPSHAQDTIESFPKSAAEHLLDFEYEYFAYGTTFGVTPQWGAGFLVYWSSLKQSANCQEYSQNNNSAQFGFPGGWVLQFETTTPVSDIQNVMKEENECHYSVKTDSSSGYITSVWLRQLTRGFQIGLQCSDYECHLQNKGVILQSSELYEFSSGKTFVTFTTKEQ